MGLMSLIGEVAGVFSFLHDVWSALPVAVRLVTYAAFGGVVYITAMKSIWR